MIEESKKRGSADLVVLVAWGGEAGQIFAKWIHFLSEKTNCLSDKNEQISGTCLGEVQELMR